MNEKLEKNVILPLGILGGACLTAIGFSALAAALSVFF